MLSGLSARAQLIAIAQERKKAAAAARAAAARASCDAAAAAAVMAESPARRDSMASESGESRAGSETACGDECKGNDPVEAGHVESGPSSAGTPVAAASATTAAHTQASDVVGAPGQVASPAHGAAVTVTVKDIAPGYGVMFSVPSFPHLTARLCRAEVARQEYRNGRCVSQCLRFGVRCYDDCFYCFYCDAHDAVSVVSVAWCLRTRAWWWDRTQPRLSVVVLPQTWCPATRATARFPPVSRARHCWLLAW